MRMQAQKQENTSAARSEDFELDFQSLLRMKPEYEKTVPVSLAFSLLVYHFAKSYCGLEVKGTENIPYGSRFLWTHNHSGWIALDAILVGHLIAMKNHVERFDWSYEKMGPLSLLRYLTKEVPGDWGVTFWNNTLMKVPGVTQLLKALHGFPVKTLNSPEEILSYRIFATPAEGEEGNCKSSFTNLYKLSRFRHGIGRLALSTRVDYISPVVIVGPEETFPCIGKFRMLKNFIGTILPIPLLVPPIPVKWIVRFLPPISMSAYHQEFQNMTAPIQKLQLLDRISATVKERVQEAMTEELKGRKNFRPWFL